MVYNLVLKFKWLLLLASFLSVVSAMAGVFMLSMITEALSSSGNDSLDLKYPFSLFVVIVLTVVSLNTWSQYILLKLSTTVVCEIQQTLLQRILSTRYERLEKIGGSRVMASMEEDVSSLSEGLLLTPTFIYSSVTVVLCFGYMLYSSWQLFLFVLLALALIAVFAVTVLRYAYVHQKALRELREIFFGI